MKNYGEIARSNGLKFEDILVEHFSLLENKRILVRKIKENKKLVGISEEQLLENGRMLKLPQKKVASILNKKTTPKSDIWFIYGDGLVDFQIRIPFSIKMTNSGTQLQVIPINNLIGFLNKNNIEVSYIVRCSLEKFCGVIKPSLEEINIFNKNRKQKLINKPRYWMNELSDLEQNSLINFIKLNKSILIDLCLRSGMCLNEEHKAEYFILNNSDFTKTGEIDPIILNYDEIVEKMSEGDPKITENNSIELSRFIGIQRKGSGRGASANSLQFKDRGYKNLF